MHNYLIFPDILQMTNYIAKSFPLKGYILKIAEQLVTLVTRMLFFKLIPLSKELSHKNRYTFVRFVLKFQIYRLLLQQFLVFPPLLSMDMNLALLFPFLSIILHQLL